MRDLTEYGKGQVVGARSAGDSVTKTAELLGFSRSTISRTMAELKKHGKTFSNQSNCGHNLQILILLSICGASWSDKIETVTLRRRV